MSYGPNNDLELFEDTPGTSEENPILIYSYAQLRNACNKNIEYWAPDESNENGGQVNQYSGGWLKLMKDINCNDECPSGWEEILLYHNFDLNGFSILAPVLKESNCMFRFGSANLVIKNGYILNLFENGAGVNTLYVFNYNTRSSGEIINVMIDCYLRNRVLLNNTLVSFKYCTFRIGGKILYATGPFQNKLEDCRVIFNNLVFEKNTRAMGVAPVRCRIEGTVKGDFSLGARYALTSSSATSFTDCVINIDAIDCPNRFGIKPTNCLIKDNYIDYMDLSRAADYSYTFYALSEDDMKDPDKVAEAGFFVVKV